MVGWNRCVVNFTVNFLSRLTVSTFRMYAISLFCTFWQVFNFIVRLAEHHVLYQYNLVNAANHYLGLIQTESVGPSSSIY